MKNETLNSATFSAGFLFFCVWAERFQRAALLSRSAFRRGRYGNACFFGASGAVKILWSGVCVWERTFGRAFGENSFCAVKGGRTCVQRGALGWRLVGDGLGKNTEGKLHTPSLVGWWGSLGVVWGERGVLESSGVGF